jgi:Flp pilus assembly protein TadG
VLVTRRRTRGAANGALRVNRRRDERGSTALEMAIIGTTLFSMFLAFLTYAIAQAGDNAGVNAAREGARVATLDVRCADAYPGSTTYDATTCTTSPSAAYTSIVTAVTKKLAGLVAGTPSVAVTCLWGASSSSPLANPLDPKPCNASVVPDVDLVRVTVTWSREATNPITGSATHSDSASMTIQGSGTGTSDPSACLANATVTPSTVSLVTPVPPGGSNLTPGTSVAVTVTTNGFCASPLTIAFQTGVANTTGQMQVLPDGTDFTFSIGATDDLWVPGTYLFVVTDANGNPITFVAQPQITVTGAQCQFVSASLSPASVVINGSSSPGQLSQPVNLSLTTTSGCTAVSTQFTPGGSSSQSLAMTGSAPNYSLPLPTALTWSTGLKAFTFTDNSDDDGVPLRNEQAVNLNVSLLCGATITLNPNPVSHKGGGNLSSDVTVTATPAVGANCFGLTLTYNFAGGSSTQPMTLQSSGVYQYTISKNADNWTVGTWPMTFTSTNNPAVGTSPSPVDLTVN